MTAQSCPRKFLVFKETFHQHAGKGWRHCAEETLSSSSFKEITTQHALLTYDAQAKGQYEPNASDITNRSLLMSGPAPHFWSALFSASARAAAGLFRWVDQRSSLTWRLA